MEPLEIIATGFLVGVGIGVGGTLVFLLWIGFESLLDRLKK
jgi:hypothetical protein